jgi:predicted nucleic acid-binding protein
MGSWLSSWSIRTCSWTTLRGFRELKAGRNRISYSVVTRCELFAGRESDEEAVGLLLAAFRELPVDRPIAERAGRIRRETGTVCRTPSSRRPRWIVA